MIVLVTGGASCGKSAYAEAAALSFGGPRYYLAAMKPFGEEGARRIERHRALRAGKGFVTVECYDGFAPVADAAREDAGCNQGTALLECLGNVVANELFKGEEPTAEGEALAAVLDNLSLVESAFANVVVVGDEVGSDGVCYDDATEAYIRVLGAAACALAQHCDAVVECIAGQPFPVKGSFSL